MSALPVLSPVPVSRLVSAHGAEVPLRACTVRVDAAAGLARVTVEQVFANASDQPLEVTYQLPLPADAAVAGFSFTLQDRVVRGEIAGRKAARAQYEQALFEGRTAALLEQDRASLFTQAVGNVPPRSEITVRVELDQPLPWEAGGWCWRFPTVVGPRYVDEGVADAARLAVDVTDGPLPARLRLELSIDDTRTGPVRSATHALTDDGGALHLAGGAARLDRDVVITWPVAAAAPGAAVLTGRSAQGLFGLVTLVPPAAARTAVPRDVILLLDVSGSMGGVPLDMLRATSSTIVDGLGPTDRLEMIAFASTPTRWRAAPAACDDATRADAHRWLDALRAGGSTEMDRAIREAFATLRDGAQRQVILITDGYIGFEARVVATALSTLPKGTRIHTVGVGQAPNRALTRPLARVGRGEEILPTPADLDASIARLCAHLDGPQIVDVTIDGDALVAPASRRLPDLYEGAPARLALQLKPGTLHVRGRSPQGPWAHSIPIADDGHPEDLSVARLFARERVADLEASEAAEDAARHDYSIEQLGLTFGIVTRCTSLVAVSEVVTVDPGAPTRHVRVPHELPAGTTIEGMGLRELPPEFAETFAVVELRRTVARPSAFRSLPSMPEAEALVAHAHLLRAQPVPGAAPAPERPAPPSKAGASEGLIARMRQLFSVPTSPPKVKVALLRATRTDDALLVVLEAQVPHAWKLTKTVEVTVDGRTLRVRVDAARSTASGPVGAGDHLRLALVLPPGLGPITSITVAGLVLPVEAA